MAVSRIGSEPLARTRAECKSCRAFASQDCTSKRLLSVIEHNPLFKNQALERCVYSAEKIHFRTRLYQDVFRYRQVRETPVCALTSR